MLYQSILWCFVLFFIDRYISTYGFAENTSSKGKFWKLSGFTKLKLEVWSVSFAPEGWTEGCWLFSSSAHRWRLRWEWTYLSARRGGSSRHWTPCTSHPKPQREAGSWNKKRKSGKIVTTKECNYPWLVSKPYEVNHPGSSAFPLAIITRSALK